MAKPRGKRPFDVDRARHLYEDHAMPIDRIAVVLGASPWMVSNRLHAAQVEIRIMTSTRLKMKATCTRSDCLKADD